MSDFTRKNILASYGKIPAEDLIEKGKKANIGEVRDWAGGKQQKQPDGSWKPISSDNGSAKKSKISINQNTGAFELEESKKKF